MKKMIMKKSLLFLLLALMTSVPMFADVAINATNFPDANFRKYVKQEIMKDPNATTLTTAKINSTGLMIIPNTYKPIKNLKGIEYFTNISILFCNDLGIEGTVNLSKCTNLTYLFMSGNKIESLNLANLTRLKAIEIDNESNLHTINTSSLTSLEEFECFYTPVNSLDFSNNPNLRVLGVSPKFTSAQEGQSTACTSLNISSNNKIEFLELRGLEITSLNLSNKNALKRLIIWGLHNLTSFTMPTNPTNLVQFSFVENDKINTLNVSACTNLELLNCQDMPITTLNVSNNSLLKGLKCENCKLSYLDVSYNPALQLLSCSNNKLKELNLHNNTVLKSIACDNNQLTELNLSNNPNITSEFELPGITKNTFWDNQTYYIRTNTSLSPQILNKDYISINGRSKLGVQCNTNNGVLTSYGNYAAMASDGNNYILVADEANGKIDVHKPNSSVNYNYNTGYTGTYDAAKTMAVNIGTSAHGMYIHPETLRGSDNFYSGTLYLEFPARIPAGVRCYYAKGLDANEDLVGLTEVTGTIPANTAVIVKAPSEYKFFAFNESDETPAAPTDNIIEGTIEGLSVAPGTVLTLGHNVDRSTGEYDNFGFWNYRGNWINPFRAYIPKSSLTAGAKNGFSLFFPEDGTTGIARLTNSDTTEDGTWYTLSGIRLTAKPTAKGIYVNGGKKVVIK